MASKQTWVILGIVGVCFVLACIFFTRSAATPVPMQQSLTSGNVTEYVKAHISELSPVREQVGGTFFVTSIDAREGAGVVSYEDGHNAYTADFTYSRKADGTPRIDSFVVRAN